MELIFVALAPKIIFIFGSLFIMLLLAPNSVRNTLRNEMKDQDQIGTTVGRKRTLAVATF